MRLFEIIKTYDIYESVEPEIVAYASKHGLGEVWWEGSGDFGHAYTTEKGTILKTTRDNSELKFAAMLVGKDLDHVVKIYDVQGSVIHMEFLETSGIDDLYYEALSMEEYDTLADIDPRDYPDMSPRVKKFISDISWGTYELQQLGIDNWDLKSTNIGMRSNGAYVIFDASSGRRGDW